MILSSPRTDCPLKLPEIPDFDSIKNLPVETVPYSEGRKKKNQNI
jgi:hypothetical protein